MADDIRDYTKTCLVCQQDKTEKLKPGGLLEPLPIPDQPWESVSLDFIKGLPKVGEFNGILVIIDRFSKYATFIPTPAECSAEVSAGLFFKHIVKYWGIPLNIVSDRDVRFTGKFWRELFRLLGSELAFSTSYHPQSDGQTERFNGLLEEYLRHFVQANQKNWPELLDVAQFSFNCQQSASTKRSPFEIVTGRQPRLPHTLDASYQGQNPRAYLFAKEWAKTMELTKARLERTSEQMKQWADKKRRDQEFQVGDHVLLRVQPEQFRLLRGKDKRLLRRYDGPFMVVSKVGKSAYKIQPPDWMKRTYHTFHVSNLKPYHPDENDQSRNKEHRGSVYMKPRAEPVPEEIIADRVLSVDGLPQRQYLVRWKNSPDEETTWEDEDDLQQFEQLLKSFEDYKQQLQNFYVQENGRE